METTMGLDFGTSNSALALLEQNSVRILNVNNMNLSERTLRSILFMNKQQDVLVGQQAVNQYVKTEGKSCRLLQSLKAFLSDSGLSGTTIYNKYYEINDLVALILKEIKQLGEQQAGCRVNRVVLGRPVFFSDDPTKDQLAENRLRSAAVKAGFTEICFEYEPIAAILAYLTRIETNEEEIVLMGDFGGGTSDFTVMNLSAGMLKTQEEKRKRILSMGGVYIGGDTFDSRIMWEKVTPFFGRDIISSFRGGQNLTMPRWIMHTLCEWHMIPFLREQDTMEVIRELKHSANNPRAVENLEHLIRGNKGFSIFQAIEQAKARLSKEETSTISYHDKHIQIEEQMSRSEFESFIEKDLATISACVIKTLSEAHVTKDQIDKVLLTGGSSFVPAVRKIFYNMFGEDKIINLDAFTSVAHGLAMSASFL